MARPGCLWVGFASGGWWWGVGGGGGGVAVQWINKMRLDMSLASLYGGGSSHKVVNCNSLI